MRLRLARTVAVLTALVAGIVPAPAQVTAAPDTVLKAGFVYNFGKFTEWPAQTLGAGALQLCLVGVDEQGAFAGGVDGRAIQGRTVRVKRNPRGDELKTCHIVYVTDPDERRQAEVLRTLRGQPVLTIGDVDGFVDQGGMIGLGIAGGRLHFDVNQDVVQSHGLKLSSQVLRLARHVRGNAS